MAVLEHITNNHSWTGAAKFMACCHAPLPDNEERQWLAKENQQHQTLSKFVIDKTLQLDLEKATDFAHTDCIEVYHSNQFNQFVWTLKHVQYTTLTSLCGH